MVYTYDGTFDGLLTTLRRIWQAGGEAISIRPQTGAQHDLFAAGTHVTTDEVTARAVWANLLRWLPEQARETLYHVFLAEQPDSESLIYRYVRRVIEQKGADIREQFTDDTVRRVLDLSRWLKREKHRMEAFVRFEQTTAGLYHATIEPDVNVLPLIAGHFARRYADQQWLIYDKRRRYGLRYDGRRVQVVRPETAAPMLASGEPETRNQKREALLPAALAEREPTFQHLWLTYYTSATIAARRSPERHRRHLPKRYWKHLTEKRPAHLLPTMAEQAARPTTTPRKEQGRRAREQK